jgi:hypothetical protein
MASDTGWIPAEVDVDVPSVARVYDYYLGGAHNLGVDRQFAEKVIAGFPEARDFARQNRWFMQRAIRATVTELGVNQFLDLGAGIPTSGPTHAVAHEVDPAARVLYVDNELIAVSHTELILSQNAVPANQVAMLHADLRDVDGVLGSAAAHAVLDMNRPVAAMILGMLHFLSDEENPAKLLADYLAALPAGSVLIASHATQDGPVGERVLRAADQYAETKLPGHVRTKADFEAMVTPLVDVIEPGITWTSTWRPINPVAPEVAPTCVAYAAVGVKR